MAEQAQEQPQPQLQLQPQPQPQKQQYKSIRVIEEKDVLEWFKSTNVTTTTKTTTEEGYICRWDENSIHTIDSKGGFTALHVACSRKAPYWIIQYLMENLDDALVNAKEWNDQTALHYSLWVQETDLKIYDLLLSELSLSTIIVKDQDGENALHYAFQYDAPIELITKLIFLPNAPSKMMMTSVKNINGKLPFELYNKEKYTRIHHVKKLQQLHEHLQERQEENIYHPGLFQHLLGMDMTEEERSDILLNFSYIQNALNTEFIRPFLLHILFVDFLVQLAMVFVISFLVTTEDNSNTIAAITFFMDNNLEFLPFIALLICFVWFVFRELCQMFQLRWSIITYLRDITNYLDVLQLGLIGTVVVETLVTTVEQQQIPSMLRVSSTGLLVASIGITWIQFIFVADNLFYSVAVFVEALKSIISQLFPFIFVVSIVTAAFAHMYYAIGISAPSNEACSALGEDDAEGVWICQLSYSYFHTFAMTLGGADYAYMDGERGPEKGLISYISMIFAFFMGIILLNILIALISDIWSRTHEQSEYAFWMNRLRIIDEIEGLQSIIGCVNGKNNSARPKRISLNDWWNENREEWKDVSSKHCDFIDWFCNLNPTPGENAPSFYDRINLYLQISTWDEILGCSKSFRKVYMGKSYSDEGGSQFLSYIGTMSIVFLLILKTIVLLPVGFVTGGLVWDTEMKEILFYGKVDNNSTTVTSSSEETESLQKQITTLQEALREQREMLSLLLKSNGITKYTAKRPIATMNRDSSIRSLGELSHATSTMSA